jgi:hypothetical protein
LLERHAGALRAIAAELDKKRRIDGTEAKSIFDRVARLRTAVVSYA